MRQRGRRRGRRAHRGRDRRGGGRRGGDLTEAADLLRPVVDAALAVARDGLAALPPVLPPPGLRRYLGFTKLSPNAVRAVTRLVDQDEDFRSRIAAAVDEEGVGRASWLWLTRPDGWEDELAELRDTADSSATAASDERDERNARRRLAATQAAAERAIATATAREQEVAGARAELMDERARRRIMEARVTELEVELSRAVDERAEAVRQLKKIEGHLARRAAELRDAKVRLQDLERQLGAANPTAATATTTSADDAPDELDLRSRPPFDPSLLRPALNEAVDRAAHLSAALRELEAQVRALGGDMHPPGRPGGSPVDPGGYDQAGPTQGRGPELVRRTARSLPGGVHDDSTEAVDYLLRSHGVVLAVDGYNVSMVGWPDAPVAEQRRRLVGSLADLAARTSAEVEVIFDGAENEPVAIPRAARQLVCVRFSPAGIEADDVLLDLVSQLPPARPVVVASSDNRVRDGARRLGANLIHARQLVAVLRR